MSLELYLAFIGAVTALMLIPGPNVALIVANSMAHGARFGLVTVAGTSAAFTVHLAFTVAGMTALLTFLAEWFELLRWLGVAYLVWLGIRAWRAPSDDLSRQQAEPRLPRTIFLRGFLVGLTNPKALLFYGAFLPQFVTPGVDLQSQLIVLAITFFAIAVVVDSTWALAASRLRGALALRARVRNRITGGLFIGAGLGLALARRP
ncbi:MAG TPA: LysE family translocator [Reyranellaceae bacterium]|nr:LysE family translocator [Reyranellaceae bacterium]